MTPILAIVGVVFYVVILVITGVLFYSSGWKNPLFYGIVIGFLIGLLIRSGMHIQALKDLEAKRLAKTDPAIINVDSCPEYWNRVDFNKQTFCVGGKQDDNKVTLYGINSGEGNTAVSKKFFAESANPMSINLTAFNKEIDDTFKCNFVLKNKNVAWVEAQNKCANKLKDAAK